MKDVRYPPNRSEHLHLARRPLYELFKNLFFFILFFSIFRVIRDF